MQTGMKQSNSTQISLKKAFAWAGGLAAVDAFLLNQGILSALVGMWMLFWSLPRAALTKTPEQRRRRLARVAIFLGAVVLVFGLNWVNNQIAKDRAEMLIVAIKEFKQKHQRYPGKLQELMPEFIDHIPAAKYTLETSSFSYVSVPGHHDLFYVAMPPFGRPTYNFESDKWGYLD